MKSKNHEIASIAPKNCTYASTHELETRVLHVAGSDILGFETFWYEVYKRLGVVLPSGSRQGWKSLQDRKDKKRKRQNDQGTQKQTSKGGE